MQKNGKRLIQSNLDPAQYRDLERIKAHHGISGNAEMIRFLIRKEARRLMQVTAAGRHGDTLT